MQIAIDLPGDFVAFLGEQTIARIKDPLAREFYLRATARFGWPRYTKDRNKP